MAFQESNLVGKQFRFESKNYPNHFIRHQCWKIFKHEYDPSQLYQLDSSFDVIPGVAGQGISLRSVNYPAYFIGHRRGDCFIRSSDGKQAFKEDVSWIPRPGLADPAGLSFESVNFPGHYMRHHRNNRVRRDANDGSGSFKEESTWYPRMISDNSVNSPYGTFQENQTAQAVPSSDQPSAKQGVRETIRHLSETMAKIVVPQQSSQVSATEIQTLEDALQTSLAREKELQQQLDKVNETIQAERVEAEERVKSAEEKVAQANEAAQNLHQLLEETNQKEAEASVKSQKNEISKQLEYFKQKSKDEEMEKKKAEKKAQMSRRRAEAAEDEARELGTLWVVPREDVELTSEELGRGGWGRVMVANFRGTLVAAKCLYEELDSDYYSDLFSREMSMAARLRHPNLVQFIGASIVGHPVILTELMSTSLRRELEKGSINTVRVTSISLDIARALNYLHLMQPHPVIHRDISSANVLLNPLPDNCWIAKVSDYGSVNVQKHLCTENPGSPVYSSLEASNPALQSPKMDIFSFGVLLIEMLTGRFPEVKQRQRLITSIEHPEYLNLIEQCMSEERNDRPSAKELITKLNEM